MIPHHESSPDAHRSSPDDVDRGTLDIKVQKWSDLPAEFHQRCARFTESLRPLPLSNHPAWLGVLERGLSQVTYLVHASLGADLLGILPLVYVRGPFFGHTLSSLPYLNYGGVLARDHAVASVLISRAIALADELKCERILLRHEKAIEHLRLTAHRGSKINVRRHLPSDVAGLDASLASATRSQVRKGRKNGLTVHWGGLELCQEFYDVFSKNMRDLGTPVYGIRLFQESVGQFADRAEFCVVRLGTLPVAAAFVTHGWGVSEVPSASSLREYNRSAANMLMYWHILERAVNRGQEAFDFGRCNAGSSVFKFKEQWGGREHPAEWQVGAWQRTGVAQTEGASRERLARLWKRMPLAVSRWVGPTIVRGVP